MMRQLQVREDSWPLKEAFKISRGAKQEATTVTVTIVQGTFRGRGECLPYAHYGETPASVTGQIEVVATELQQGADRNDLRNMMPPGAARNAVDCALWDLEAKMSNRRVWRLLGISPPANLTTAYTISLDTPDAMARAASRSALRPLLKVKLGGSQDLDCVKAVRDAAPDSDIILDANEGWDIETYHRLVPAFADLKIRMIEQPFPAGQDEALAQIARPVPICADESCHDISSLADLSGKYDMINIKLDKTGGLTEALEMKSRAMTEGMQIMVGCMVSTSLSMAPAMMLGTGAAIVDLDGPLLLAQDRDNGLEYDNSQISLPDPELWG